ncbi:cysteine desulfurase [Aureibacillus halotolerans]|uniref:Cysteine desulfurase n=1 Tax=Aureibacillus halotolerans TaxID=1508390 RepID=A0A4R6TYR6_9BACI|nr:cysteine desulfurase [Aureibacillus halotolerans]
MIYLDNSATTKPFQEVVDAFSKTSLRFFANPASIHSEALEAEKLLSRARQQLASLLHADEEELVFTSGGTEGNHMAIFGRARAMQHRGKHIITTKLEHPSVQKPIEHLEQEGFEVTWLTPNQRGVVTAEQVKDALRDDTILVSIMHVNNELGSIQPVQEVASLLATHPLAAFHVDHVQGAAKLPLALRQLPIDLLTLSSHKFHGMKGSGVLFVRKGTALSPIQIGGTQEGGRRAGTVSVPGAVALAKAFRLAAERYETEWVHLGTISQQFRDLLASMKGVRVLSPPDAIPTIVNIAVPGLKAEILIHALSRQGIFASTQSACSTRTYAPSRVLLECGHSEIVAGSAIRFSLSCETKQKDLERAATVFQQALHSLQKVMKPS